MKIAEPPWWRLGRPIKRTFTPAASLMSYGVIMFGLLAISLFTLFTKAYQDLCIPYQYTSTEPAIQNPSVFKTCQPATIYPGQTFSGSTSFVYKALTLGNMTKPYPLGNCELVHGGMISALNFPVTTPILRFNVTFVCQSPDTDGSKSVGFFNGREIMANSVVLTIDTLQGSEATDIWFNQVRTLGLDLQNLTHAGEHCDGRRFVGWEIYGDVPNDVPAVGYMSNDIINGDIEPCIGSARHVLTDYDNRLFSFFDDTIELARRDLASLSPLPNLIFTCPSCTKQFLPWTQIVWLIAVALGSSWSIVFILVTSGIAYVAKSFDPEYDLWLRTASLHQNSGSSGGSGGEKGGGKEFGAAYGNWSVPGTATSSTFLISRNHSRQASFAGYASSPPENSSSANLYQYTPLSPPPHRPRGTSNPNPPPGARRPSDPSTLSNTSDPTTPSRLRKASNPSIPQNNPNGAVARIPRNASNSAIPRTSSDPLMKSTFSLVYEPNESQGGYGTRSSAFSSNFNPTTYSNPYQPVDDMDIREAESHNLLATPRH